MILFYYKERMKITTASGKVQSHTQWKQQDSQGCESSYNFHHFLFFSITSWWLELTKKVTPSCVTTLRNCLSLLSPTPNYSKLVLRIKLGYTCFFKVSILLTELLATTWPNLRPVSSICWHWDIVNMISVCMDFLTSKLRKVKLNILKLYENIFW